MESTTDTKTTLQAIHHPSDVQLLDDIDKLRSHGISHLVALPQLVVCGDQSSGKSSVLEAISGIPFPTKDNLCTRFATEVVLRRTSVEQVSVTITPSPGREQDEAQKLQQFNTTLSDLKMFGEVLEGAKTAMGVVDGGSAFTDDVLRVDISGPDRPHLTIVDLPGLIHSHNKFQSTQDIEIVRTLVQRYMTSSRSIILAVVSAKNDYANQIVLKMALEADPRGQRTLGIITKPDTLPAGSESEADFVSLAKNEDVSFDLGWHVLKNRDYDSRHSSSEHRDQSETNFLSQGVWSQLPRIDVGVANLRSRLSKVLLGQIKHELPDLIADIELRLSNCRTELGKLGQKRQTTSEQRSFLLHLAQNYQHLARAAIDGVYGDPFFGDPRSEDGYRRRVRAIVQNLGLEFAETMRARGHRYQIVSQHEANGPPRPTSPKHMSRNEYLEHAKSLLTRSRGRELPGTFNPMLIADLFHEQCTPWRSITIQYVEAIWSAARDFLESAFKHLTQDQTAELIMREMIEPNLQHRLANMCAKVDSIIDQYKSGHPITYNHYFTETIQNVRAKRMEEDLTQKLRTFFHSRDGEVLEELNFTKLKKSSLISALSTKNEVDMDRYACGEAVDCMLAFYKAGYIFPRAVFVPTLISLQVAMKNVVDNVATQCWEDLLIRPLPDLLAPTTVIDMGEVEIDKIAKEPAINVDQRDFLTRTIQILELGLETCRKHVRVRPTSK
jgi:GTPase SAR1 family protein